MMVVSVSVSVSLCACVHEIVCEREKSVNFIAQTYAKRILRINRIIFGNGTDSNTLYRVQHTKYLVYDELEYVAWLAGWLVI